MFKRISDMLTNAIAKSSWCGRAIPYHTFPFQKTERLLDLSKQSPCKDQYYRSLLESALFAFRQAAETTLTSKHLHVWDRLKLVLRNIVNLVIQILNLYLLFSSYNLVEMPLISVFGT